jgi:tetratricopeptide (TPR) repeat protein
MVIDAEANKLAKRLDGLPLALTTTGAYINQTAETFASYLQMYEESWNDLAENDDELQEYGNNERRTLYSTWNLSLKQIEAQDPEAVKLLQLIAYLGNGDLWYALFQKGADSGPAWLSDVVKSKPRFNKAMGKLQEYSLVEVEVDAQPGQYGLHTCVHDWALEYLNREVDGELYGLAVHCVAASMKLETEAEFWIMNRRLVQHVIRLENERIRRSVDWNTVKVRDIYCIAYLNNTVGKLAEAEALYQRALDGYEKARGPEHQSTLDTANNLGNLYAYQGKLVEAEAMYQRALDGNEKAWGPEHTSTLDTVNNLGLLYKDQGKLAEAEAMYQRALDGKEKAWGPEHTSTLGTVNNLGLLYKDQGKLVEAEALYQRALDGYEKAWGPEHTSTLDTVNNLGNLYAGQGKLVEAEAMYQRALDGYEKAFGDNATTYIPALNTFWAVGSLFERQTELAKARIMYSKALGGYEKVFGPNHLRSRSLRDMLCALDEIRVSGT